MDEAVDDLEPEELTDDPGYFVASEKRLALPRVLDPLDDHQRDLGERLLVEREDVSLRVALHGAPLPTFTMNSFTIAGVTQAEGDPFQAARSMAA